MPWQGHERLHGPDRGRGGVRVRWSRTGPERSPSTIVRSGAPKLGCRSNERDRRRSGLDQNRKAAWSVPRVRDLTQVAQGLVHLSESLLPDVVCPLLENPLDLGVGCSGEASRSRGQSYQSRATVGGVGDAFHVARCLELLDQEGRALLGDPGLLGKVGDPGPVGADPGRHASLSQGDVRDAGSNDGVERSLLECAVGDEEQDAEFLALTRVSHRVILDK